MHRTELVERPADGRVFTQTLRPMLADCAPSGRARLDAVARWLQDVADAAGADAGLAESVVWVIRRGRLHVKRWPRFGERLRVDTFCSGLGRMWAERRTTVGREDSPESDIEAVALWVHLDPESGRPTPLTHQEIETYGGGAAAQRRVTARLRHPPPPAQAQATAWRFRAAERDLAGHINNAAYWQVLEEELLASEEPSSLDVEIEYRSPAQPGEKRLIAEGHWRWIVDGGGEAHASIAISADQAGA
jgi:acyl-ACP thioesterase